MQSTRTEKTNNTSNILVPGSTPVAGKTNMKSPLRNRAAIFGKRGLTHSRKQAYGSINGAKNLRQHTRAAAKPQLEVAQ